MKLRYFFFILLTTILGTSSCDLLNRTEYEVSNNTPYELSISFYEYDESQREVSMTTAYFTPGQTHYFTPTEQSVAIKVFMNDYNQWVQRIYYINKGKTTYILISPDIQLGYNIP